MTVVLSTKGQIVVPKEIRERAGLGAGDKLDAVKTTWGNRSQTRAALSRRQLIKVAVDDEHSQQKPGHAHHSIKRHGLSRTSRSN